MYFEIVFLLERIKVLCLISFRLSGYFESIKKSFAEDMNSTIKSRSSSFEKDLLDSVTACPQTVIASRQSKETSTKSPERPSVTGLELR